MGAEELLLALVSEQICQRDIDGVVPQSLSPEELEALYNLAKKQDLAHIAGHALAAHGVLGQDPISEKLRKHSVLAVYRHAQMNYELTRICQTLEQNQIHYIPLKGSVLRAYYPEPWMRTSCDIDILVREEVLDTAIRVLTERLGYTSHPKSDHDVSLFSSGGVHLELHFDTIQERYETNNCRQVLAGIWEDATPKSEGSFHYCMSDPMFYFYHMAHMAKHFEVGGCGIRPFLDIWILNNRVAHDRQKREQLLEAGGLLKFARAAEKLSAVWFSGGEADSVTRLLHDYILRAGLYGDNENRAAMGQAKRGGKFRYLITQRVFMPYDYLKAEYPILKKHKWLTPAYQVVRWLRMLFSGHARRTLRELKSNMTVAKEDTASAETLLKELGL
jgi:hypothetical protein